MPARKPTRGSLLSPRKRASLEIHKAIHPDRLHKHAVAHAHIAEVWRRYKVVREWFNKEKSKINIPDRVHIF